jgi:hypothetical protein
MRKLMMGFFCIAIAMTLIYGCADTPQQRLKSDMLGLDVAKDEFNEMRSLYVYCKYVDGKAYDVYNYTLGEAYAKQAQKAYKKGKGPNFERARVFSLMAIPHLKIVQKKYLDSEG